MEAESVRRSATEEAIRSSLPPELAAVERFVACVPYPVQIFAPDGTMVMANEALLRRFDTTAADMIGHYNVLKDPTTAKYDLDDKVRRVFAGEPVIERDVRVPVHAIKRELGLPVTMRQMHLENICSFPVTDTAGKLMYVVNIYFGEHNYRERGEILDAIAHIEEHWREGFSIEALAHHVNLSTSYFCRLFKEHTGITPHEYYTKCKIEQLKEALLDANLTVEQAFTSCGVAYHGYYARLFRQMTGFSPSQYRKLART